MLFFVCFKPFNFTSLVILVRLWKIQLLFLSLLHNCTFTAPPSSAIKVWDFQAALDPRTPADAICLRTLVVRSSLCPSVGYMYVCVYTFYLP